MYIWYTHLYAKQGENRRYKNPSCRRCASRTSCASGAGIRGYTPSLTGSIKQEKAQIQL